MSFCMQGATDKTETWYGTEYSLETVPGKWLEHWQQASQEGLHLPKQNPFIPTDFSMLQVPYPWQFSVTGLS